MTDLQSRLRRQGYQVGQTRILDVLKGFGYSMADTLMSAYAMFATKAPSMIAFEDRLRELRIEKPFKIKKVPSDTQMREIFDGIDIEPLNEAFADLFWELQRSGKLRK